MILYKKNELLEALKSQLLDHNLSDDITIKEVVIDSRKAVSGTLFIALKGENNDGHNFLTQCFENGCAAAIVHDASLLKNHKNLILVKNSFDALNCLAQYSRKKSSAKIIGVTGSVGKTSVKEMLKLAFSNQGKTYATTGNLNNHFGLPLTICNMPADTEFAVLEMGMNHLHEIEILTKIARPHVAIITTIAPAHIGNFNSEEEIALAKSEIFLGLEPHGFALINHDNKYFNFLKKRALNCNIDQENILSFGKNLSSNYRLSSLDIKSDKDCLVSATTLNNGEVFYELSVISQTTILNSLIAVACLDLLGNNINQGLKALKNLQAAKGRGEIIELKIDNKNITIIDDSYNANVASMKAGLHYLGELKKILHKKRAIAILGDMFELGDKASELHQETLRAVDENAIDFALVAGDAMTDAAKKLDKKNYKTYLDSTSLAQDIKNMLQDGDILLVKGSRGMKMEKIFENLN